MLPRARPGHAHDARADRPQARPLDLLPPPVRPAEAQAAGPSIPDLPRTLFPSAAYARAWTALDHALPPRDACRTMVGLLVLASIREACEIALAARLDAILDAGRLPDLAELETEFATRTRRSSEVEIPSPNLDDYNRLLPSAWERRL